MVVLPGFGAERRRVTDKVIEDLIYCALHNKCQPLLCTAKKIVGELF